MTDKRKFFTAPALAMAAVVATGLTAAPAALDSHGALGLNSAAAQTAGSYESAFQILGTTADEMRADVDQVSADTASGPLGVYERAMRNGNLDAAARVLAQAAHRPVTEALVLDLNKTLGVDTSLSAEQVATAAAAQQDPKRITMAAQANDPLPFDHTTLNVHSRQFDAYEAAARKGNLDAAAKAFARATELPVTEKMVRQVNEQRGIQSRLSVQQVAKAAVAEQKRN
ncbi:MAG: hypothetical protein ACFB13_05460 [Kiloniellaceae bacterium]